MMTTTLKMILKKVDTVLPIITDQVKLHVVEEMAAEIIVAVAETVISAQTMIDLATIRRVSTVLMTVIKRITVEIVCIEMITEEVVASNNNVAIKRKGLTIMKKKKRLHLTGAEVLILPSSLNKINIISNQTVIEINNPK